MSEDDEFQAFVVRTAVRLLRATRNPDLVVRYLTKMEPQTK